MQTETLTYEADGLHMVSHLYYDEQREGRRPGVLVFPEAFGLGDHAKLRAERLAGLGYVTLACDLHGDGRVVHDLNEALGLVGPLRAEPARARSRAGKALAALQGRPEVDPTKIAAIGYCYGGAMAFGTGAQWGSHSRGCGLPQRPGDGRTSRCQEHQGQGSGLCWGRRPFDPARPAQRLRARDARGRG